MNTCLAAIRYGLLLLALVLAIGVRAAPTSQPWELWQRSDAHNSQTIDHSVWQGILDRYLDNPTDAARTRCFRYGQVTATDRQTLQGYIAALAAVDPRRYQLAEQQAYWLNLYNALTIDLVLTNYPVSSITKIGAWYQFGPWDKAVVSVAGQKLTLNDIEHRILRPLWQDPRIHYAVNCASLGCPDLSSQAFTAANTDALLDAQARRFINQAKGVSLAAGKLTLSKIYEWYAVDFGDRNALIAHLQQYANPALAQQLSTFSGAITYQYDWRLNDVSGHKNAPVRAAPGA